MLYRKLSVGQSTFYQMACSQRRTWSFCLLLTLCVIALLLRRQSLEEEDPSPLVVGDQSNAPAAPKQPASDHHHRLQATPPISDPFNEPSAVESQSVESQYVLIGPAGSESQTEAVWASPASPKGLLFLAHGCSHRWVPSHMAALRQPHQKCLIA